jgi:hypothetical protein
MQTADQLKLPVSWQVRFMHWLRLTDAITIKVYHGYGHDRQLSVYGHVLHFGPVPRKKFRRSFLHNTLALLRLFMVKPIEKIEVSLQWEGKTFQCKTDKDGFFRIAWESQSEPPRGWNEVQIKAIRNGQQVAEAIGKVYVPYATQYGFISDIDDTFLISHSSSLRKRLWVLFTENARSRNLLKE